MSVAFLRPNYEICNSMVGSCTARLLTCYAKHKP